MFGLALNVVIVSDSAKHDFGPSRPPLLLAEKLSLDGFKVFFVSSSIGSSIRKRLIDYGIVPIDFRFRDVFRDASKNMFLLWSFENLFRVIARKYKKYVSRDIEDAIVLNFSSVAGVVADVWYAQGPFFPAFLDMDWRSYPFHYFVLSRYLLPYVKLLDVKHVKGMRKLSRFIVANSRFTASMYRDLGVKVDYVIYPPLDTNLFKPSTNSPSEDYVLTYIGKETDFKVLDAVARRGVKVYAFGSKEQVLPEPLKQNSFFHFLGRVSTKRLIDLYSNALFTLFPFTHEPFGYIPVESLACAPPGVQVTLLDEAKDIVEVQRGDEVIGFGGMASQTIKTFKRRYVGDLVEIKALGMLPLELTPEHPVLVAKVVKEYSSERKRRGESPYIRIVKGFKWKAACNVRVGDYLVFPKFREKREVSILKLPYKKITCPQKYVEKLELTPELAELFGYYVSEGACGSACEINFGKHEYHLIKRVKDLVEEIFPYEVSLVKLPSVIRLRFGGTPLVKFMKEHFGNGAPNKKIPGWLLYAPRDILRQFLKAIIEGDGYIERRKDHKSSRICIATSSRTLALQLQMAFSRFGVFATITCDKREGEAVIEGRRVHARDKYLVRLSNVGLSKFLKVPRESRKEVSYHIEDDKNFYVPVKKVRVKKYCGNVYNLQTLSGTYLISNIVVHNCGTPVLTYDKQGPSEVVVDGETGWLARSKREIVSLALKVWENGYSRGIRRKCRERALKFDVTKIYSIWKKVLEKLIS